MHDERHPHRPLEEVHLVPQSALAKQIAVIGGKEDDRLLGEVEGAQRGEQFAYAVIDIRDRP